MMAAMALSGEAAPAVPGRELDPATLARARNGDPIAFRAFVVRYERPVFALLSRLMGRGREVEDLAQETFLRAFRALPGFDPDGPARVSTWLLTIATRLALDARKKRRPEPVVPDVASDTSSPERLARQLELRAALARAIEALPDDQRAAFVLAEFHDFSLKDIAEALGAPVGTIKTRVFRAREKLQGALADFKEDR
ncbi:MAG: sigma-70 family RNA polymerase sigma factor [Sorangiineae bacterium PRO1]|nr:sigma-70 family RNA polymerase sigma factor [Sorangiineae bacterium PRO1]